MSNDLVINHSPDAWHGTFGVLVKTLFDDLLSDGEPVEAFITTADGTGPKEHVVAVTDSFALRAHDGRTIEIDDIVAVRIPG